MKMPNDALSALRFLDLSLKRQQRMAALALLLILALAHAGPAVAQILATIPIGSNSNPHYVAVNEVTNKIYVLAQDEVGVIDGATNQVTTVSVPGASALAINAKTNKIYVSQVLVNATNTVTVIDGNTNATTTVNVGIGPVAVAVNDVTNKIYVSNFFDHTMTVIDGATNQTTTISLSLPSNPSTIAVDTVTNQIYVLTSLNLNLGISAGEVAEINGATNSTAFVSTGFPPPQNLAVDATTNKIYAVTPGITLFPFTFPATVTVIDGATNNTATVNVGNGPQGIAVNAMTNKIYVSNTSDNTVTAIDGATNGTTTISTGSQPFGIAIDAAANRIYVSNFGGTVTAIDGATNRTATVPAGANASGIAVNSQTNRIYVANDLLDGTVTVIDAAKLPAVASASPNSLLFFSDVNVSSASQPVTLTNTGLGAMTIDSIAMTGADGAQFNETDNCPIGGTLAAGASCTIHVTFTPTSATPNPKSASLAFNLAPPTTSASVALSGVAGPLATKFLLSPGSQVIHQGAPIYLQGGITTSLPPSPLSGTISVTIGGVTNTAPFNYGIFNFVFDTQLIPASTTPYPITYSYAGDQNYLPASDSSTTLTVLPQLPPTTTFNAVGSSAMFNSFAMAAGYWYAIHPCGVHHWSRSGGATLNDPRSSSIPTETGDIWIAWDDTAKISKGGAICFYVGVDSATAVRAYQANAQVNIDPGMVGSPDGDIVPLLGTGEALPQNIYNFVNKATLNAAITEIRPEDAKFATLRALATPAGEAVRGSHYTGLGYGSGPIGAAIGSSQSGSHSTPVDFAISGSDPFTNNPARGYALLNVGVAPLLAVVNTSNTNPGHLGDGNFTNVNRFDLAHVLTGQSTHIRSIAAQAGLPDAPLHVFLPGPLSGEYNVMEYSVPNSREAGATFTPGVVSGQETGVDPTNTSCTAEPCGVESGNPLWHIDANGATRGRVLGSAEMLSTVASTPDSLGYAFWSFENFRGKTNLQYLTVDGVDPLYAESASNPNGPGKFPRCREYSNGQLSYLGCPRLFFPNLVNGSYPIWNMVRMMYDRSDTTSNAPTVAGLVGTLYGGDNVAGTMVFRSHYAQVVLGNGDFIAPSNGFKPDIPEAGGDMGGAILTVQSEIDYVNDTGDQQVGRLQ